MSAPGQAWACHHIDPANMPPAVLSRRAVVDTVGKLGDAIGIACAFAGRIRRTVHGVGDHVFRRALAHWSRNVIAFMTTARQ
jgi:hypothetical protein